MIEQTLQSNHAYRKVDDSLYVIKQGSAYVMINVLAWGPNKAAVRCWAQLLKGVQLDLVLATELLEFNGKLHFGAFAWDPDAKALLFTHTILGGTTLDPEELMATLTDVALTADEYDDKLMQRYGGQRMRDLLDEEALHGVVEGGQAKRATRKGKGVAS